MRIFSLLSTIVLILCISEKGDGGIFVPHEQHSYLKETQHVMQISLNQSEVKFSISPVFSTDLAQLESPEDDLLKTLSQVETQDWDGAGETSVPSSPIPPLADGEGFQPYASDEICTITAENHFDLGGYLDFLTRNDHREVTDCYDEIVKENEEKLQKMIERSLTQDQEQSQRLLPFVSALNLSNFQEYLTELNTLANETPNPLLDQLLTENMNILIACSGSDNSHSIEELVVQNPSCVESLISRNQSKLQLYFADILLNQHGNEAQYLMKYAYHLRENRLSDYLNFLFALEDSALFPGVRELAEYNRAKFEHCYGYRFHRSGSQSARTLAQVIQAGPTQGKAYAQSHQSLFDYVISHVWPNKTKEEVPIRYVKNLFQYPEIIVGEVTQKDPFEPLFGKSRETDYCHNRPNDPMDVHCLEVGDRVTNQLLQEHTQQLLTLQAPQVLATPFSSKPPAMKQKVELAFENIAPNFAVSSSDYCAKSLMETNDAPYRAYLKELMYERLGPHADGIRFVNALTIKDLPDYFEYLVSLEKAFGNGEIEALIADSEQFIQFCSGRTVSLDREGDRAWLLSFAEEADGSQRTCLSNLVIYNQRKLSSYYASLLEGKIANGYEALSYVNRLDSSNLGNYLTLLAAQYQEHPSIELAILLNRNEQLIKGCYAYLIDLDGDNLLAVVDDYVKPLSQPLNGFLGALIEENRQKLLEYLENPNIDSLTDVSRDQLTYYAMNLSPENFPSFLNFLGDLAESDPDETLNVLLNFNEGQIMSYISNDLGLADEIMNNGGSFMKTTFAISCNPKSVTLGGGGGGFGGGGGGLGGGGGSGGRSAGAGSQVADASTGGDNGGGGSMVPEPSTWLILSTLLGLVLMIRQKKDIHELNRTRDKSSRKE